MRIYLPRTSGCPQGYRSARSLICGDRKVPGFESQFCSLCLTLAVQLKCLPSDCLSVLVCNSANQHQAQRRQWHPTPVLLPGKSHGWRSLKGYIVHGVAEGRTRLSEFTFTFHFHALEKEMATHSSVLAWRIPGTGEPGGLPSMGSHRVGHD